MFAGNCRRSDLLNLNTWLPALVTVNAFGNVVLVASACETIKSQVPVAWPCRLKVPFIDEPNESTWMLVAGTLNCPF